MLMNPRTKAKLTMSSIVAVPAIGADPVRTWVPYLLQRPRERTRPLLTATLPTIPKQAPQQALSPKSPPMEKTEKYPHDPQDVDEDGRDTSHGPWLTKELREKIPQARVILYNHGSLKEGDTLSILAERLLRKLCESRKGTLDVRNQPSGCRPIFFICHSTGGLVAKEALVIANQMKSFTTVANATYGMTFIATPHQGSLYLASNEFAPSVRRVMGLRCDIPRSLQQQLSSKYGHLSEISQRFKSCSTDLRIDTYYETNDSNLAFTAANDNIARSYHVPIASVASAILDLDHESETPLSSDHVGCATFEGEDDAQDSYIAKLRNAVGVAIILSKKLDCDLDLEEEVKMEVNGFFEDSNSSVKLWTARPSVAEYFREGPENLLKARLTQSQGLPRSSIVKEEVSKGDKQDRQALQQVVAEEPKAKLQEKLQNKIRKRNKPRPTVNRSATDPQPRREEGKEDSTPDRDLTSNIQFSWPNHPNSNTERRSTIAPTDPGPYTPAMDRLKLVWVHVPFTHTGWVPAVLDRLSKDNGSDIHSDFLKDENWTSHHNRGRHSAPHARYIKSAFIDPDQSFGAHSQRSGKRFAAYVGLLEPPLEYCG